MVTPSQVPLLTHASSGSESAENLMAPAQSPGFNQFPSGGANLPVWMVAGGDGLGGAPGGLGSGFGNGFFSSSSNTGAVPISAMFKYSIQCSNVVSFTHCTLW